MKMHYAELKNRSRLLQSLTGLNRTEFEALLPSFSAAWDDFVEDAFESKKRQRASGAGRKAELNALEDKLLFILVYFRQYPTQEVQGYLFGIRQAQANQWIHRLTGVLNQALGDELQLPERRPAKLKEVLSACPELVFMIDGTERPINRPKDKDDQKTYYSGKKKGHTVKNNVVTNRDGKVLYLSDTYEGKKHDKKIADEEDYQFPSGSKLLQDTGFQGHKPDGVTILQPKKKPRGGELSHKDKILNRAISRHPSWHRTSHWRGQTRSDCGGEVSQSSGPFCGRCDGNSLWTTQLSGQPSQRQCKVYGSHSVERR